MTTEERQIQASGWTSTIYRLRNTQKVIKVLDSQSYPREALFQRERAAYERMSQHSPPSSILKFYGVDEPLGLILELAEEGSMDKYLWDCRQSSQPPEGSTLLKWARQASQALAFVHHCGIIHCDIHVANFFLDHDLNLKLGDFGAAVIDGSGTLMTYRRTHQLWEKDGDRWRKAISVASEVFALGSAMFTMENLKDPLEGLDDDTQRDEIARRIKERELPPTDVLTVLGVYIKKCWSLEYQSMSDMLVDLGEISPGVQHAGLNL